MSRRETVYIAGPYRADTPEGVALNIARAEALGAFAARQGLAPVVIHSMGEAVFGDGSDPETHERAIQTGEALAAQCDRFWGILRPGAEQADGRGYMSAGTDRERRAFENSNPEKPSDLRTWDAWRRDNPDAPEFWRA